MNEKQRLWTFNKCNELISLARFPLSEKLSKEIKELAERYYKESKRNEEVKQALVTTLNFINNVDEAHIKYDQEMKEQGLIVWKGREDI